MLLKELFAEWFSESASTLKTGAVLAADTVGKMLQETVKSFDVWAICTAVGLGLFLLTGSVVFCGWRQRTITRNFAAALFQRPTSLIADLDVGLEEAELELAILYRRLEAYLRDPYDLAGSRIRDDDGFHRALDFAVALNLRIGAVGTGATQVGAEERSQVRQQILQAVWRRVALQQARPSSDHPAPSGLKKVS